MGFVKLVGESVVIKESVKVWPHKNLAEYADWTYRKYIKIDIEKFENRLPNVYSYKHISIFANMPHRGKSGSKDIQHWKNQSGFLAILPLTCQCRQGLGACCKVTAWGAHLKLVPDSDMPTVLDGHGHLSVILKCILHALSNLRIGYSLSVGCVEHFHKCWLMYAKCDLNVTRAPSIGHS